ALNRIRAALKEFKPVREEVINRTKAGEEYWLELEIVPVADATGKFTHFVSIERDITERKRFEHQLLRAQRMESIGTLAGGIAHDLNNVLAPIMMSIELLKLGEQNPRRLAILSTIESSARHGADMVRQVLSFAEGARGQKVEVQAGPLIT